MTGQKWRRYVPAFAVALLVALAYSLRIIAFPERLRAFQLLLRSGIYFGLFIAWGVSVNQRVIQPQSRRLFTAIAVLMVLWMCFRTARYLSQPSVLDRYCWYLYYIPMLFIPLLTTLSAALLGKPARFRLPRWTLGLYAAAGCIALLVLTNDLHHMMFIFPEGAVSFDAYSYGPGFLLPSVWRYGGLLSTLALIFFRSRLPGRGKRFLLPILSALALVAYHIYYLLSVMVFPWLRAGDLTVTESLLVVCILESCLRTGLIPRNTGYDELMRVCEVPMIIVDGDFRERIAAAGYTPLPPDTLRQAVDGPVILENGLRLSSAPIQSGHVLWEEDISELLAITADLSDKSEYLTEQVLVRKKEVEARRREQALTQRNRLYDRVIREIRETISLFSELTDRLEACCDQEAEALLTAELAIVCTQIKRSVNLVFIEESRERIDTSELSYTIKEWLMSLRLANVNCDCVFEWDASVGFFDLLTIYSRLARILLTALPGLKNLLIRVQEQQEKPLLLIVIETSADLSALEEPGASVQREDEAGWVVELTLPEGGAVS